tara:strand:+ start:589 stop:2853 length:2265 start_codon:yes stop_codon:yes gene_type:complete
MPNWKKLIVSGSDATLNSLSVSHASGSFSGSFQGDGSQLSGITVNAATTVEDSFTSQTSISITHDFGTKNIIVSVYNSDDEQIIPQSVTTTTNDTVDIVFQSATSGRVVVVRGGHIISGSAATASLALELSNLATASIADFATTASHALNVPATSSHALTAVSASIADELSQLATASFAITASHALNVPATSSHALTAVTASFANELSGLATASIADFATTASHALNVPDTSSHALTAVSSSFSTQAGTSRTADSASVAARATTLSADATASFADLASDARTATSASFATQAGSSRAADSASVAARATTLSNAATASFADVAGTARNTDSASVAARATLLSDLATASFANLASDARTADSASVAARATELSTDATASFANRATSASISDDIKDGVVTNAKLTNDSVTIGTTEVDLGQTVTSLVGLENISAATGTFVYQIFESSSTIITSGSNIFGNDQSDIQQITGSLKQSGSFTLSGSLLQSNGTISGSFEGNGSALTGITADSADSASVAARATTLSANATSSHALTAVTASHTAGTASISNYATSASFAITASHLLGGAGNSGSFSGSFQGDGSSLTGITVDATTTVEDSFTSQTSISITHNFGTKNIIVSIYNSDDEQIIPQSVTTTTNNTVDVVFQSLTSGRVVVVRGGHIVSGSAATASLALELSNLATASFAITASHALNVLTLVEATFSDQTNLTASHDLDSTNLIITVYNNNNEVLIPQNIRILNADNVGFDFATSTSGKYVLVG